MKSLKAFVFAFCHFPYMPKGACVFAATVAPIGCATFQPADPMRQKESASCELILMKDLFQLPVDSFNMITRAGSW